jgi:hypothetical protein
MNANGVPRPSDPRIKNAGVAVTGCLRSLARGLDLSADEIAVAAFVALSVVACDASLPTRAWLASACSIMDAERPEEEGAAP